MKNPWITFSLSRIGVFALFLAILMLFGFDAIFSTIIAGVLALAVSLVFFQKQRDALSKEIYRRMNKSEADDDIENQLLDSKEDGKEPKGKK